MVVVEPSAFGLAETLAEPAEVACWQSSGTDMVAKTISNT